MSTLAAKEVAVLEATTVAQMAARVLTETRAVVVAEPRIFELRLVLGMQISALDY